MGGLRNELNRSPAEMEGTRHTARWGWSSTHTLACGTASLATPDGRGTLVVSGTTQGPLAAGSTARGLLEPDAVNVARPVLRGPGHSNVLRLPDRTVIAVDSRNTSRTCPSCGHTAKENRLTQATFACTACGFAANADYVGATNVLNRAGLVLCNVA
ncbi:zinc ribbon domain-containing protein [Streptomyces botrytidirepellens]|uniref:zinc ribbon domain-containing protein n=1 Tax=Streptomyces botrytidirepellens TaxID=2486417 RepID=UPI0026894B45